MGHGQSFRILILEPPSKLVVNPQNLPAQPELLRCRLVVASLYQEKEYDAISYAWGSSEYPGKETILCNGAEIQIKSNLAAALRRLRCPDKERALWADAICINQKDLSEKASQVPIMREIYANARQVIVWLGEGAEVDKEAFALLRRLSSQFAQEDEEMTKLSGKNGNKYWVAPRKD